MFAVDACTSNIEWPGAQHNDPTSTGRRLAASLALRRSRSDAIVGKPIDGIGNAL